MKKQFTCNCTDFQPSLCVRNYFFNHVLACIAQVGRAIQTLYFVIMTPILMTSLLTLLRERYEKLVLDQLSAGTGLILEARRKTARFSQNVRFLTVIF